MNKHPPDCWAWKPNGPIEALEQAHYLSSLAGIKINDELEAQ